MCPGGSQDRRQGGRPSSTQWRRSSPTRFLIAHGAAVLFVAGPKTRHCSGRLAKAPGATSSHGQSRNAGPGAECHAFASTFSLLDSDTPHSGLRS